jgi:hypothetical protein
VVIIIILNRMQGLGLGLSKGNALTEIDLDRATGASSENIRKLTGDRRHPLSTEKYQEVLDYCSRYS